MQASRFAGSFVELYDSDFAYEAGVLARAAFEHAVTAHWVYFTVGGLDRYSKALRRTSPPFGQMMWDLDSNSYLRTTYRWLSVIVHPTHSAVSGYLARTDGGMELRHCPAGAAKLFPALYSCAISSMLAFALLRHIVDPATAPSLVEEKSVTLRLPPFLDDALQPEKRRFPDRWSLRASSTSLRHERE